MKHTKQSLMEFEDTVANAFATKQIHAPIHLSGGNEEQLIQIFQGIHAEDWVFSNWRSHYHALLKGIPDNWILSEILAGRSMYLMNQEYRFMASSIVGGVLPIACGVALGIKLRDGAEKVWVFVGDMTARTGLFHEFHQYCSGHHLPVEIIIEDNGFSTNTPTAETWGTSSWTVPVTKYRYQRTRPHVGIGQHISF